MSHPMVDLTEHWLNLNPADNFGTFVYYNRIRLRSYGVDWIDLWCDGTICPDCQDYWADWHPGPVEL